MVTWPRLAEIGFADARIVQQRFCVTGQSDSTGFLDVGTARGLEREQSILLDQIYGDALRRYVAEDFDDLRGDLLVRGNDPERDQGQVVLGELRVDYTQYLARAVALRIPREGRRGRHR